MATNDPTPAGPSPGGPVRRAADVLRGIWGSIVTWASRAWDLIVVRNLFTSLALGLALFLLVIMPQTSNLLWQLPTLTGLSVPEFFLSTMFWLFVVLMVIGYLLLSLALEPAATPPAAGGAFADGLRRVRGRIDAPLDVALDVAVERAWRFRWWILAAGVILLWSSTRYADSLSAWLRTAGPTYAFLILLVGLWLAFATGPGPAGTSGFKHRLVGRALAMLVATTLLGQFLWMLFEAVPWMVSPRVYTMWAIIQVVFLVVTTGRVIDVCHVRSAWNVRALATLGLLAWLMVLPGQQIGRFWRLPARPATRRAEAPPPPAAAGSVATAGPWPQAAAQMPVQAPASVGAQPRPTQPAVLPMNETLLEIWFNAIEARLANTEPDRPVVFIAASGGGARAALFTALVLEALQSEPLPPKPIPGGGPPAPGAPSGRTLADQIVLISSVSGGSLASAYYVGQNFPHLRVLRDRDLPVDEQQPEGVAPRPRVRHAWHNTFPGELYSRMHRRAEEMLDAARQGRGRAVSAWAGPRFEKAIERVAFECERLAEGRAAASSSPETAAIAPWLATSAFVDDMAGDFMAPLLRGVLTPGLERGVSVSRFWEDQFGWRNVEDTDLHRQPDQTIGLATNGAPVLLFNSCDVEQGSRLILGFPPLPPGLIRDPLARPSSHLPYSLTDRGDLYYHLSLAEAVRLSANFPFGFDVGRLPLADGGEVIHALDGGIVDNSGIDSIIYLLRGLDRSARAYRRQWERIATRYRQLSSTPADSSDEREKQKQALRDELIELSCRSLEGRAYRLLSELARRKILLIQIDSGKKDIQASASWLSQLVAGFSPSLFRPFQAMNNAGYTSAELAVEDYDLALARLEPLPTMICECFGSPTKMPSSEALPTPAAQVGQAPAKVSPAPQAPAKVAPGGEGGPPPPVDDLAGPPREVPEIPPSILRVRLTCNQSANIMTAWSLGPEDKAQTIVQFLIEWLEQEPVVRKGFDLVSRVQVPSLSPGEQPHRGATSDVLYDYQVYRRGQKLVDRARGEFYQFVGGTEAPSGMFGGTTALLDEAAREDLDNYNKLFREEDAPAAGRVVSGASASPRPMAAPAMAPAVIAPPIPVVPPSAPTLGRHAPADDPPPAPAPIPAEATPPTAPRIPSVPVQVPAPAPPV